ncbi:MAG: GAF domain-containing protein [Lachnospiraceae bacterium]|nr:GAF domain-containing protein [Lachnospiraceae bacterium]
MTDYAMIREQVKGLAEASTDYVPLFSNVSAILYEQLPDLNWAGFYLMDKGCLLVGPFQGKAACIRIQLGKGVCGTAAAEDRIIRVEDVHEFPGHIACDAASNSEIVVPLHGKEGVVGVLDIDSPKKNRFSEADEEGLAGLGALLDQITDFSRLSI